jgi:hypothetical protein
MPLPLLLVDPFMAGSSKEPGSSPPSASIDSFEPYWFPLELDGPREGPSGRVVESLGEVLTPLNSLGVWGISRQTVRGRYEEEGGTRDSTRCLFRGGRKACLTNRRGQS